MLLRELLLATMHRQGLNQTQAAEEVGVSPQVFSRWVNDNPPTPSPEHCARIASFLGIRRDDVMQMVGYWDREELDDERGRRQEPGDPIVEMCLREIRDVLLAAPKERRSAIGGTVTDTAYILVSAFATIPEHDYAEAAPPDSPAVAVVSRPRSMARRRLERLLVEPLGALVTRISASWSAPALSGRLAPQ
jgi:transcriptional regulator with XRE-family HTH domain